MNIRFLGQSGYLVSTARTTVIIDPYLSDSVNRVAGRPRMLPIPIDPAEISCDAVVCTHDHLDHLDPDTVSVIPQGQYFVTTVGGREKLATLGQNHVQSIKIGEKITVGGIELEAVFADHTVEAFGLLLRAEGLTLYFSGDTLYSEKLFAVSAARPDVAFLCINGKLGNMNVEEALAVAEKIGAPVNLPNHYDMFASNSEDPHLFADRVKGGFIMEFDRTYTSRKDGENITLLPLLE